MPELITLELQILLPIKIGHQKMIAKNWMSAYGATDIVIIIQILSEVLRIIFEDICFE